MRLINSNLWIEHLSHWKNFLIERLTSSVNNGEMAKVSRQLKVIEQIQCAAVLNPRLLIEFIKPSATPSVGYIHCNFNLDLNESQQNAVKVALGDNCLSLIQGPPGTGKTQVIAEICLQLFNQNPNIKILVCSETHVAVNNIIARISECNHLIRIVRIGDKEMNSNADEYSPESILNYYKEWINVNCIYKELANIVTESLSDFDDKSFEKALALSANIIGMTCNRVGSYGFNKSTEMFDVVIIDEVCKATLPEILMPLSVARKAVLVGDPKQLPPVFCTEEIDIIRSIDKCNLTKYMYIDHLFLNSNNLTRLDTQYRMTSQIGNLINELFYEGKLKNGRDEVVEEAISWIDYLPAQPWPLKDVQSAEKQMIYNLNECEIISNILNELNASSINRTAVAVITPYKPQVSKLRMICKPESLSNLLLNIDSVDGFQGKECDVVIFSLTRTVGPFRFLADSRRLNVALSRARDKIIIVGNLNYATKNGLLNNVSKASKIIKYNSEFVIKDLDFNYR